MFKSKKRRIWSIIGIIVVIFLGFAIFRLAQHPVVRSYFVNWSNLDRITPKVYVDPKMSQADRDSLLNAINESRNRIASVYGDSLADPVIIAGQTMDVMEKFGGNAYNRVGRTYQTALGAYIIFGPDGIASVDVIAHEMAHAELTKRLGYKIVNNLPDWFDEGLALQVDERFTEEDWLARTDNRKNAPNLDTISTITHDDWLAYATAKHTVNIWLEEVGQPGLLNCVDSILQDGAKSNCYIYDNE